MHEHNGVIVRKLREVGPGVSARRARFNKVLFIDARGLGHMVSRTNCELSAEDVGCIADTYHAWRGEDADFKPYEDVLGFPDEDVPGFCAAPDLDAIHDHNQVLIPSQYISSEPVEGDGEPPDEKIARLTAGIGG